jgi:hypothetical protein
MVTKRVLVVVLDDAMVVVSDSVVSSIDVLVEVRVTVLSGCPSVAYRLAETKTPTTIMLTVSIA